MTRGELDVSPPLSSLGGASGASLAPSPGATPPAAPSHSPTKNRELCPPPGCPHLLFICDGLVAAIADPHFKLEAHQGDGGALGAALAADGLPALAAVVL